MNPLIDYEPYTGKFAICFPGASWTELHDSAARAHWQEPGSCDWTQAARAEMTRRDKALESPTQATKQPLTALETELLGALRFFADELPGIIRQCCPLGVPASVSEAHDAARAAIAKATSSPAA